MTAFQYKKPRSRRPDIRRIADVPRRKTPEQLTGFIQGIRADSKAEERFSIALYKRRNVASFRYSFIIGTMGMPGWKQLDFLVQLTTGTFMAFSVKDTEFVHHGVAVTEQDAINEIFIRQQLEKDGIIIDKVRTIDARDLDTQNLADNTARRIFG